ncbi:MAG: hypothetical protein ACFFA4_15990, partial [Promethearchaeota archaeon]
INGVNTTWYSLDGGLTNITFTINGLIDQTIWDSFGEGFITITFYANNSIGTEGSSEVIVLKDICAPKITINTPDNNPYCNKAPTINIYASDINFNKLWCGIQSNNISLINGEDFKLNTSIWDNLDEGFFQIFIFADDTVGHLNDSLVLNLCKDTINPIEPQMSIYPTGEVSLPIIFDWEEVNDTSGIKYYRLIIDNEANPFATPGFIFETNISNTYYELVDYLIPRNYYFFIYPIDNAGNQGNPASDIFTIKGTVVPPTEFPWWIIVIVILISVVGSVTAIVTLRKKSQKEVSLPRKKIPLKLILGHVNKIISPELSSDEIRLQNMVIQKEKNQIFNEASFNNTNLDINIDDIKNLGEELFNEGAYLEAIRQFQYAKEVLSKHGRNEDAALFSDLITGIEGLIEERERRLEILKTEKIHGNSVKIFELYYDIIEISEKLRDLDAIGMFESELIKYFQINKFKLKDIELYLSDLEKEAEALSNNGLPENAAQIYGKCEKISQFLSKLENEGELSNVEKY